MSPIIAHTHSVYNCHPISLSNSLENGYNTKNMGGIRADKVTNIQLFYFRLFGMWPHENSGYLYYIYGLIFLFIFSFAFSAFMVINLFVLEDISQITDNMYMALTEVALFVKIVNFFIRFKAMQSMFRTVQNFQLESAEEEQLIRERLSFFLNVSIYYYACANSAVVMNTISALSATVVKLPFHGWYGLDWRENRNYYWLIFAYQTVGMTITANLNITIELFPMLLMFMASVKMELLGRRMQLIGWCVENTKNTMKDSVQNAHLDLINSIETHKDICT